MEGYRNFLTKIWNAAKFCEMNECHSDGLDTNKVKNIFNNWILSEYENCRKKLKMRLKNINSMKQQTHCINLHGISFVTGILNFQRSFINYQIQTTIKETKNVTSFILSNTLIMLHPIIPFFTEHFMERSSPYTYKEFKKNQSS